MSGQGKADPKNMYGATKIEQRAAEEARRREECEEAAIEHDRATKSCRATYAHLTTRKERLNGYRDKADKKIAALLAEVEALRQQQEGWAEELGRDEEKFGVEAEEGKKAAEISAKYKAYLELKSETLGV